MFFEGKIVFITAIIISCFLSFIYEKIKGSAFSNIIFYLLSVLLILTQISTDSGVDYRNYYRIAESMQTFDDIEKYYTREPLFSLWCIISMSVFNNANISIIGMKLLGISVVLYSIYYMRRYLNVFIAIMAYCCLYFVQSVYLIRIQIAAAFILLAVCYWYRQKNIIKIFIPLLIACGFHFSAFFSLIPFSIYFLTYGFKTTKRHRANKILYVCCLACVILLPLYFISLLGNLMSVSDTFEKFHKYDGQHSSISTGLFQIFRYLPIAICSIFAYKCNRNQRLFILFFVWSVLGFSVTQIPMGIFIRMFYIMSPLFLFYLPLISYQLRKNELQGFPISSNGFIVVLIIYFIVNFNVTTLELFDPMNDAELNLYHYISPFDLSAQ